MGLYILIAVMVINSTPATLTVEFTSEEACTAARDRMLTGEGSTHSETGPHFKVLFCTQQ